MSETIDFNSLSCSFIGLGLIGGSIAKALRNAYPGIRLTAYDPDNACILQALDEKVLTQGESGLTDALFDCDFLFLCAPVSHNDSMLSNVASSSTALSDCCMTITICCISFVPQGVIIYRKFPRQLLPIRMPPKTSACSKYSRSRYSRSNRLKRLSIRRMSRFPDRQTLAIS